MSRSTPSAGPILGKRSNKYAVAGRMLNLGRDIRERVEAVKIMASRPNQSDELSSQKASLAPATSRSAMLSDYGEVSPLWTNEYGLSLESKKKKKKKLYYEIKSILSLLA